MKPSWRTLAAIIALSAAVWVGFYLLTPGTPLKADETVVVVGACTVVLFGARWIWSRWQKGGQGEKRDR